MLKYFIIFFAKGIFWPRPPAVASPKNLFRQGWVQGFGGRGGSAGRHKSLPIHCHPSLPQPSQFWTSQTAPRTTLDDLEWVKSVHRQGRQEGGKWAKLAVRANLWCCAASGNHLKAKRWGQGATIYRERGRGPQKLSLKQIFSVSAKDGEALYQCFFSSKLFRFVEINFLDL